MVRNVKLGAYDDLGYWLPILARVVKKVAGVTDYNIVQNNGMYSSCLWQARFIWY